MPNALARAADARPTPHRAVAAPTGPCRCGHAAESHVRGDGLCRKIFCDCSRYTG